MYRTAISLSAVRLYVQPVLHVDFLQRVVLVRGRVYLAFTTLLMIRLAAAGKRTCTHVAVGSGHEIMTSPNRHVATRLSDEWALTASVCASIGARIPDSTARHKSQKPINRECPITGLLIDGD